MTTMTVEINKPTGTVAERLTQLAQLYQEGQASPLLIQTLDKLFAYEIAEARTQLEQLRTDLAAFEAQYTLPSDLFYQHSQTDDRMDFVEWASLIQMVHNLEKRLHLLTGED